VTKKEIRSKYLELRLNLSANQYASFNQELVKHFFATTDLSVVKTLHAFLPILSKKEPDTWLIIDQLKKKIPDIKISIPRVENNALVNFYFEGESQLEKNEWNILEPKSGERTLTEEIDLVIVPLLAFDKNGNRVGYGKGFYDKFLKTCRKDCKKIGLSLFDPAPDLIPTDQYDIALDAVFTPRGVIQFQNQLP
jgi:5-formyltetrahydrofolate cyclo-ligase